MKMANDEMIQDLRRFMELTNRASESLVPLMDDADSTRFESRRIFSEEVFESFIRMVGKLETMEGDEIGPPDLLIPVVNLAATLCLKIIQNHHPLGACDTCVENTVKVFEVLMHMADATQIDPNATVN